MPVKRIVTGFLGATYLALTMYIGGWLFNISVLLISFLCMREFYNAYRNIGHKPIDIAGFIFVIFALYMFLSSAVNYIFIIFLVGIVVLLCFTVLSRNITPIDIALTIMGVFYPGVLLLFLILFMEYNDQGVLMLILLFSTTWSTDTFAYFVGTKYGKNKLCPSISPKKTIEGSLGGLCGSIIIGVLAGFLFTFLDYHVSFYHYIIIGGISGIFSQFGDLTASIIKRYCSIKDYGSILPGHGGLFDRFDSLLFTAPIIYLYIIIFL